MKICLINHLWDAQPRSGAEQAVATLAAGLREAGHEVFFIATSSADVKPAVPEGVRIYFLPGFYESLAAWPMWRRLLRYGTAVLNPFPYWRIRSIVRQEKPDVVWTHNLLGFGYWPLRLGRQYRHIHTIHDIQLLHPSGLLMHGRERMIRSWAARLYQAINKCFLSSSTLIVSPSRWLLQLHKKAGLFANNPTMSLPNPVPLDFARSSTAVVAERSPFHFLYVGQIEAHKGVALLIDAFSRLPNHQAVLTLIGDGSLVPVLRKQSLDPRIIFRGRLAGADVSTAMSTAACLVVPSLCYENQPTVILEAFACGLPVIASDFSGTKELLENPDLLFAPTVESLTERMAWAGEHPADCAALSAAAYARLDAKTPVEYARLVIESQSTERP